MPSGGLVQDSAGETFSPTQFGLDLLLPANFVASRSPSLKLVDDSVNTPCARGVLRAAEGGQRDGARQNRTTS